jgi:hypothetical protein
VPSIVELRTQTLDYGIPGISDVHLLLLFALMLAISMIPYFFLYRSLRDKVVRSKPVRKMFEWTHGHRHPHLLHH